MINLKRPTLAQQAYEELQSQIVSGHLPAGRRLFADELADQLSISETPVKEALALLERDGLIEGTARKASAVRRFTIEDIREIYEARELLELNALSNGQLNALIDKAFLDRLELLHQSQMLHAGRKTQGDLAEAIRFDREFHEAIVGLSHNTLLIAWHRNILRQTQTIRNHSIASYDAMRSRGDHGALIAALAKQDFDGARAVLHLHLIGSRDGLIARWTRDHAETE